MRRTMMIVLVGVAGCATAHTGTEQTASESVRIVGAGGGNLRMAPSDGAKPVTVAASVDRVWAVLPAVFDSLGIAIDNLDAGHNVIGHSGMKLHRQLGKTPLTRVIDCGSTQGFPSAEAYEIQFSIFTQARKGDGGMTALTTTIQAVGRPMAFAGEYVKCSTKGTLETMIADGVKARVARAG